LIEVKTEQMPWSRATMEAVCRRRFAETRFSLYPAAKRCLDVICASVLLACLSPLMALIALAIWLDSPGPAVFRQRRVGKWGKQFTMLKFRSMFVEADEKVHAEFARDYINGHARAGGSDANGQVVYKPNGDKRITRVGRWLRRTSLDELPQLVNVLRGDMSLVGPRPAVPYEVSEYSRWHLQRLAVLPGLTGLAQISGRSGLTFEKIVRLDLEYIRHRSLSLDLAVLAKTIPVVLRAKCAA
jgi:lipopolysaccharide/colanic/teichoic acid biosynthesis glycosyltransferase